SANSMPRPLKAVWYSPAKRPSTRRRVRTWSRRTSRMSSWVSTGASRDGDAVEDALDDLVGGHFLGLGLVAGDDAMAEDVEADSLDVCRRDVGAALDQGVGAGRDGEVDAGAGRGAELDQAADIEVEVGGIAAGVDDVDDVVLDPVIE